MFQKTLQSSGLTKSQAEVLNFLLEKGAKKASVIAKNLKKPRQAAYKNLEELIKMELVERVDKDKKVSLFRARHPSKIETLFEEQEKELKQRRRVFRQTIPDLTSLYNLSINKPGVRFYEGFEGVKKVLQDTLLEKDEILTFLNSKQVFANSPQNQESLDLNDWYWKKREKLGIKKRIIDIQDESVRKMYKELGEDYYALTQVNFLKDKEVSFNATIQIYNNKIAYQVVNKDNVISVIIEDKNIHGLNKTMFEALWVNLSQ
ncbi:MAG: winged helix DNA-binding protein [Candidatus Moranbacteria bacterium]|nr:winged helix DNA-binding protein [Candidatus Moranbacteria bacterium]